MWTILRFWERNTLRSLIKIGPSNLSNVRSQRLFGVVRATTVTDPGIHLKQRPGGAFFLGGLSIAISAWNGY